MKRIAILSLIAAISIFTSCEVEPVLSVSVKEISAPFSGNETSVVITANNPWVVQGTEWCVVEPASGEAGEFTVTVKVKPNETYDFRECEMKVSSSSLSEVIKVSQKAESVLVSEFGEYILGGYEQELSIPIQSNVEVDVTVSADWIQLKEVKGLETSTLIFSVQKNGTYDSRKAEIVVKEKSGDVSKSFTVIQEAISAILVGTTEYVLNYMDQEISIPIQSNVEVEATVSADWIQLLQTKGLESSTLIFVVQKNETYDSRDAEIVIKEKSGDVNEKIMVTQNPESVIQIDQSKYSLSCSEQEFNLDVKSNVEMEVSISVDWIQWIQTKGLETSELSFNICKNEAKEPREGVIVIKEKNGEVECSVTIRQQGVTTYLPTGTEFNEIVERFLDSNSEIVKIEFIANSAVISEFILSSGIYMVKNGSTLEIHTEASQFMANSDCSMMFYAYEGYDDINGAVIYNSLGRIENIDFGEDFNTENVTGMQFMFSDCQGLTSLDLSCFNTENVTDMTQMFYNCTNLESLDLSNLDTGNVRMMINMFRSCENLVHLNISNFNTESVTNMSFMFENCKSLVSLDLSSFNTENVTDMGSMFYGCSSLTSLDVSNFDTQNVTGMSYMFSNCSGLTSLDVSNFETQNVTDMGCMFHACSSLTSLDVNNFNTQNVTYMGAMFCGCSSLTSLDVNNFNTQNVTDMGWMFEGCSSLTSLDVSNFNTQNVTDMGYMFERCSSFTSLDLSNFNTQNVTGMYYMFYECSSLTSLDLSSFSFSASPDINEMFTNTGRDAANKPIWIYVTTEAMQYIVNSGRSGLDNAMAKLVVEGDESNFISGDLGETDGGNW